jgi:hypothetical protein
VNDEPKHPALRDDQNPRWDDRRLHNWLDREVRFDAAVEALRVVCRVPLGELIHVFGPVLDEEVFGIIGQHRLAIEAAAIDKICQEAYTTDIRWGDPGTVSILLTGADIQRAIAARSTLEVSATISVSKAVTSPTL